MPTTTYDIGLTGTSFTGAANREDLLDVVTLISPTDSPLFTMFRKAKVSNVQTEWLTDTLTQAASNAVVEGSSAVFTSDSARVRLSNYTQISRGTVEVSDTQRAANPAGIKDQFRYELAKKLKQWKRDVEHDIIAGNSATATPASTRCARGIYRWLSGFSSRTANIANAATMSASNLQEDDLNGVLMSVWTTGGLCDYVVCTPTQKKAISTTFAGSANSRRNSPLESLSVTNVVDWYYSDFGNVKILPHRWITSAAVGGGNLNRLTFALQSDKWVIGFLRPPKTIPLAKIGSAERAMIEGEWTLICMHPSANTFVSGHAAGTFADNFPSN